MKFVFFCSQCESEQSVVDPIKSEFPCECGGVMRMKSVGVPKKKKEITPKVVPSTSSETITELFFSKKSMSTPNKVLKRYKVCQCSCGKIQVTEASESLKCRSCGKTTVFRMKGDWHVKLKDFDDFPKANTYLMEWTKNNAKI